MIVPKFGSFTFSAPGVTMPGLTNPTLRDLGRRVPVFIVSPNFFQGGCLRPGVFSKEFGHIRPYDNKGVSGNMQLIKCNFTEVGILAGISKDTARLSVERILKDLQAKVRASGRVEMVLPGVGCFNVYDGIAAVAFEDALIGQAVQATNKNLKPLDRKNQAENFLNSDAMEKFQLSEQGYDVNQYEGRYMGVEADAKAYLENKLNISLNHTRLGDSYRPLTASVNYDNLSVSFNKAKRLASARPNRGIFSSNMNRSSSALNGRSGTTGNQQLQNDNGNSIRHPLSIRYQNMIQPTSVKIADTRVKSIVKKRIGLWMREQSVPLQDAFFLIVAKELGDNVNRNMSVDRDLFARCLLLLDIGIDERSALTFSEELANQNGKIDAQTFMRQLGEEDRDDLNQLRDVIYLHGLNFEDILKTMDIPKETAELDFYKISKGVSRLDPKMSRAKADQLAQRILGERDTISTYDLIESLEGINKGESAPDLESNKQVLRKIRIRLLDSDNPNLLIDEFEKIDQKNDGQLDPADFKTCLLKLKKQLDLTIGEVNRIGRYEPKNAQGKVDYNKFLDKLDREIINLTLQDANALNPDSLFSLKELRHQIKDYLGRHKISPLKFLANLVNSGSGNNYTDGELKKQRLAVPIEQFKSFLHTYVLKLEGVRPETADYYIHKIDIDRDGIIDGQDLDAFLTRHKLIEDTSLRLANTIRDVTGEDYDDKILQHHNQDKFFPVAPLTKSRVDLVLRSLRNAISGRNISFREFFTKLDENKDGLISFDEFKSGIKQIVKFSDPTVKGLFAYMDRNGIGLVDFDNFLKVMKKSVLDSLEEKTDDNFDWQVDIIKQMKQWFFGSGVTSEDAFRIMDSDYDQLISKSDLRHFLQSILFIPVEEVTSIRIDRLFNLMDQYKRGRIGYEDFRKVLTEDFQPTDNISLTGGVSINKHSFDWKLNARQKIGIFLSRKYKSLDSSFDEISMQGPRITFEQFSKWVFNHSVLDGFNLTEKLLKDLFSDFDPHKKGHLTRPDWAAVFAPYDSFTIKLNEIVDMLSASFGSPKDAFDYLASFGPSKQNVYLEGFMEALENLFPGRFTTKDKETIWRMISSNGTLYRMPFARLFNSAEFSGNISFASYSRLTSGSSLAIGQ